MDEIVHEHFHSVGWLNWENVLLPLLSLSMGGCLVQEFNDPMKSISVLEYGNDVYTWSSQDLNSAFVCLNVMYFMVASAFFHWPGGPKVDSQWEL